MQAGLSGVIDALSLRMLLHTAKRTGVVLFHRSGFGYAVDLVYSLCQDTIVSILVALLQSVEHNFM